MGMSKKTRRDERPEYVVEGTAVRKLYAVPQERPQEKPHEVPYRRKRKNAATFSIPYCIFLMGVCMLTFFVGAGYLQQQALSTSNQKEIAKLENKLAELKKENKDELNRIESSINLDEIRDIAIHEYGMVYASEENVILYDNTTEDYVVQYVDIP